MRKLLRRSSFKSQAHLKEKILAFIDYFNRTMAKSFEGSYAANLLTS